MPCRSDYMEPSKREKESKRVMEFLKETGHFTKNHDIPFYGETDMTDTYTQWLCEWCQDNDVTEKSLELQIWWRDHQAADKARVEEEINSAKRKKDRDELMNRLTEYERSLLGIK